jgi:hypothetical protein
MNIPSYRLQTMSSAEADRTFRPFDEGVKCHSAFRAIDGIADSLEPSGNSPKENWGMGNFLKVLEKRLVPGNEGHLWKALCTGRVG